MDDWSNEFTNEWFQWIVTFYWILYWGALPCSSRPFHMLPYWQWVIAGSSQTKLLEVDKSWRHALHCMSSTLQCNGQFMTIHKPLPLDQSQGWDKNCGNHGGETTLRYIWLCSVMPCLWQYALLLQTLALHGGLQPLDCEQEDKRGGRNWISNVILNLMDFKVRAIINQL